MSMLSNLELIRRVPLFALLTSNQAEAVALAQFAHRLGQRGQQRHDAPRRLRQRHRDAAVVHQLHGSADDLDLIALGKDDALRCVLGPKDHATKDPARAPEPRLELLAQLVETLCEMVAGRRQDAANGFLDRPGHAPHAVHETLNDRPAGGVEQALQAVTLNAAKVLGIADKTGSIEVGKDANIVISTGDILDMRTSTVTDAFIQGRKIDLTDKQKQLNDRYNRKYGLREF